jgi:hypothetical protein
MWIYVFLSVTALVSALKQMGPPYGVASPAPTSDIEIRLNVSRSELEILCWVN